jgi:transposase
MKGSAMNTLWVGIDIGKANLVVATLWQGTQLTLDEFANNSVGFCALAARLQTVLEQSGAATLQLVVEPTGGYEQPLVAFAHDAGWPVSLPNPRQVRQWAQGTGQRAKTDRAQWAPDAWLLARFGAAQQPAPHHPLATEVSELDSLLERRLDLEAMIQQEKNRLGALRERPGIAPPVIENLERVLEALQEALQEVERAIAHHLQQHAHLQESAQRLLALPGIGPKIVLPLLVLLHRWQTLTAGVGTAKGLTAFVGLDPRPHESGWSVRKRPAISKMGNATLRRLLYMGALSAVHGKNPLRTFYQRLLGRGKAKKLSVVAAARKLLSWAWVIFSRQLDWNSALHAF